MWKDLGANMCTEKTGLASRVVVGRGGLENGDMVPVPR